MHTTGFGFQKLQKMQKLRKKHDFPPFPSFSLIFIVCHHFASGQRELGAVDGGDQGRGAHPQGRECERDHSADYRHNPGAGAGRHAGYPPEGHSVRRAHRHRKECLHLGQHPPVCFAVILNIIDIIIISWRFSSEKCPTNTAASFFLFFFRQTKELTLYAPLFVHYTLLP